MKIANIDVPYAQIPNRVLFDPKLSWKAKGVWAYIQAKPNNWDFSSERMASDSTDGVYKTRAGIDELIKAGYLIAKRLQSGRMAYSLTEKATMQKLHCAETAQSKNRTDNKERSNTKKDTNKLAETSSAISFSEEKKKLEDNDRRDMNIIALYMDYREKTLKPNLQNKAQLSLFIKRHIKSAKALADAGYTDDQLVDAFDKMRKLDRENIDWTLETIIKSLTK